MSALVATLALELCDLTIRLGTLGIYIWALWSGQFRPRTRAAATVIGLICGVAIVLRLCGVKP